jgi:TrpR-related protein YerC/YecD
MLEKELNKKEMKELFEAILQLKDAQECRNFFRDLCTFGELSAMSERLQVVKQVESKIPYRRIAEKTGASTATITRVAHWFHHGMGGYKLVLERLK